MRGATGDVAAAERQLNAIEDLLKVLPRRRGFRVSTDGSVSVYPATQRAWRFPAAKQEGSLKSKRASRSEQGSKCAATNARTCRSAARAAKHAERRDMSRRRSACGSLPARWRKCSDGSGPRTFGPPGCGTRRPPPPPPAFSTARCPCSSPRRASTASAQQP